MKINNHGLEIALARKCREWNDFAEAVGIGCGTQYGIRRNKRITPQSAGKNARALGVSVKEIVI